MKAKFGQSSILSSLHPEQDHQQFVHFREQIKSYSDSILRNLPSFPSNPNVLYYYYKSCTFIVPRTELGRSTGHLIIFTGRRSELGTLGRENG